MGTGPRNSPRRLLSLGLCWPTGVVWGGSVLLCLVYRASW